MTGAQVTEQSYCVRCVRVMEKVQAAWTGPEQSGGGGVESGGAGQDLESSDVSSALTLKPLTLLYASSPPDCH